MVEILKNGFVFGGGLFLLVLGAGWLIQSSLKFAYIFKLTPLFIGLILIAFGTSCPEAAVGIIAVIKNQKGIALGNIVGSFVANIGLILGLCSLLMPLDIDRNLFKRELPIMSLSVILLYILSLDLVLGRLDGLIFLIFFIIFCFLSYKKAKTPSSQKELNDFKFKKIFRRVNSRFIILLLFISSLTLVILGANLMVKSGVVLAKIFGISSWVIGITVFAIGTSLPELAASLAASFKKIPSISVGNIVGSNIFNILFVLGVVSLIRPINIEPSVLGFEFPVLFLFSILFFMAIKTGYKITRGEGLVMLVGYIGFVFLLLLS